MAIKIVSIRALVPFKLVVEFNDGSFGTFDASGLVREGRGSATALKDRAYFGQVTLENGVPTWPNYFDISPDWLQAELANRGELQTPLPKRTGISGYRARLPK